MEGKPRHTPKRRRLSRRDFAVGITVVMLVVLLILLWEFHGYLYQFFTGSL